MKKGIIIKIRVLNEIAGYRIVVGEEVTLSELALALLELEKARNKLLEIEKQFKPQYSHEG